MPVPVSVALLWLRPPLGDCQDEALSPGPDVVADMHDDLGLITERNGRIALEVSDLHLTNAANWGTQLSLAPIMLTVVG